MKNIMNCPLRIFWSISPGLSYWCMSKGKHTYKLSMDLLVYFHKVSIVFEHLSKAYLRSPASASDLGLLMISSMSFSRNQKVQLTLVVALLCWSVVVCGYTQNTHTFSKVCYYTECARRGQPFTSIASQCPLKAFCWQGRDEFVFGLSSGECMR